MIASSHAKAQRRVLRGFAERILPAVLAAPVLALVLCLPCAAQGLHHPFAVGANEGAIGSVHGLGGWLLAKESGFYRLLSAAIRSARGSGAAAWGLAGLSLAYGVFHAAGPGHGKMVIATYMLANERALRRGIGIAFGAALLQGLSAVAIVGVSALLFRATAKQMTLAANAVEIASYAGIVILGVILTYAKGAALLAAWRVQAKIPGLKKTVHKAACAQDHHHGRDCAHFHAPDPSTLGSSFSWKNSVLTMAAAGLRPCSGAILVLGFALAQKIFSAGVFAVAA
ncbi:MAG: high frequency lysogenization protein HflD, partial [Methylocapsa sp.]|nr:high frequency lysogenization protein HflD [Methylocapsa sp.]